jgi:Recombination endonuclease VII
MNNETRICSKTTCKLAGQPQPIDQFSTMSRYPGERKRACRACCSAYTLKWRSEHPDEWKRWASQPGIKKRLSEYSKKHAYKKKYGLDEAAYEAIRTSQDGRCAICRDPLRKWFAKWGEKGNRGDAANVDHCHKTGKIRGLLCTRCNRALGLFRDSPTFCRSAARYLESHQEPSPDEEPSDPSVQSLGGG